MSVSLRGFLSAEIQALWITAFLDGRLCDDLMRVSREEAEWEALLQSRFYRWRAPMGSGKSRPDMAFETLPYIDSLLRDLELNPARKSGWWREIFEFYGVGDYRGLVGEWMDKEGWLGRGDGDEEFVDKGVDVN
jgi:hypothetical protein